MFLSKTRIIGVALGIVFLACFMNKELYGYEGEFHERIVDVTFEMMSRRYPNLPREYLKIGSTQPDEDRKKVQERFLLDPKKAIEENEKHKRDTTRINNNYKDAVKRYNEERNQQERLNQGTRILGKAFHYVSDQTEPDTGGDFSNLMGGEFRGVALKKLKDAMANDKQLFFNSVKRSQISFDPRNEDFLRKKIAGIRGGLEARIKDILGDDILEKDKAIQEEVKNKIDQEIWNYLVEIVAIQNLMLEEFAKETKIESGAFPPTRPQPQSSPLQTTPYAGNDVKVQEDRCRKILAALDAAFKAKDINRFRAFVEQAWAANCDFYQEAYSSLLNWEQREKRCREILAALDAAFRAKDINLFRAWVEKAGVANCDFYQEAYNSLLRWERCMKIESELFAASKAKDINRFRAWVQKAEVEKCDFYQNALNHLRNWEQELQRSAKQSPPRPPAQPQPPPDKQTWHGARWEYKIIRYGNVIGEGWFEISYSNGVYSLKATHCKNRGCPNAVLLYINNNALKIKFNDKYDNELEVWKDSIGTYAKHWSHKNPNPEYRQGRNIQISRVLRGGSSQTGWR